LLIINEGSKSKQWIIADLDNVLPWIDAFVLDRKASLVDNQE